MADKSNRLSLTINGVTKDLVDWCKLYSLKYNSVRQRHYAGETDPYVVLWGKNAETMRDAMRGIELGAVFPGKSDTQPFDLPDLTSQVLIAEVKRWLSLYYNAAYKDGSYSVAGGEYYCRYLKRPLKSIQLGGVQIPGKPYVETVAGFYLYLAQDRFTDPDDKRKALQDCLPCRVVDLTRWSKLTLVEQMLLLAPTPLRGGLFQTDWSVEGGVPSPNEFEPNNYGGF